jgi:hypothetical protein
MKVANTSKVAKLIEFSLKTRIVVDIDATEDEMIEVSYSKIQDKITNRELGDNLVEVENDEECPFGAFDTDNPSIDTVILSTKDKQYCVVGRGVPFQTLSFDSYSDWDCVNGMDGHSLFDVQIDFDDSLKLDNEDDYYQFQYVDLIPTPNNDGYLQSGYNWGNTKEFIVTHGTLAQAVADYFQKK